MAEAQLSPGGGTDSESDSGDQTDGSRDSSEPTASSEESPREVESTSSDLETGESGALPASGGGAAGVTGDTSGAADGGQTQRQRQPGTGTGAGAGKENVAEESTVGGREPDTVQFTSGGAGGGASGGAAESGRDGGVPRDAVAEASTVGGRTPGTTQFTRGDPEARRQTGVTRAERFASAEGGRSDTTRFVAGRSDTPSPRQRVDSRDVEKVGGVYVPGSASLSKDEVRELRRAAAESDARLDTDDIVGFERSGEGGFDAVLAAETEREFARRQIAERNPDIAPTDILSVQRTDDGFEAVLTEEARLEQAKTRFFETKLSGPDLSSEQQRVATAEGGRSDTTRFAAGTGEPVLAAVPREEFRFTEQGGEVDVALTDRGLRIAAASRDPNLSPDDVRVVGAGAARTVELAGGDADDVSGGASDKTVFETTSPGARFFGTQDREEAIEQLARSGSVAGQVFVGGEAIEQLGVEGSRAVDEIVPRADRSVTIPYTPFLGVTRETELNPRVGIGTEGKRLGTQVRNAVVGAPTGAGVLVALPFKATGDIGVRAEAAVSNDVPEAATISAGASTAAVGRAGGKFVKGIKQEPVGAALDILTPYAVSRVSPVRLRQTNIPDTTGDAPSPSTARQLGGAAEAIRRGQSPRTVADVDLGATPSPSSTTITGVRLEMPAAAQRFTGPTRGRTLVGFRGARPTAGSPSVDPQRVDFTELPGKTATTEPIDPLRTDVLQATGRQAGGEVAARTQATRELVGRAAGETVPGSRRIRQAADTIGIETSQRLGRARARAAGAANRITGPISKPVGRAANTARDVAQRPVAAARRAGTTLGVRIGEGIAGGVRRGQQARQQLADTSSTVTDPVTRRVEALDDAAFQAGRRTGETLSRLDDAAFQAGRRVGSTQVKLAQRVGRTRGRLSDLATRTVQRPRSAAQRATRPLTRPIEQRAFQAGRRTGETISRVESTAGRLTPDLPSRPGRRTVGPAEDIVREVRAVPGDRAGDVVDALDETGATIFGSAAVRGQADEFRQPRDLDVIVPDEAAARERFSEALEGSNADVEDVFDIKQIGDAPGRARGGERIKFGQQSREKLETDEGIPVNPIEEELLRKAGAAGFFRAPGAAGTARFDVGPEPRRAGRADVREKDIYDAVDIGEEVFGPGDPAVERFRSAFTDQPVQRPSVRAGGRTAGVRELLADERGQTTLTPAGRAAQRDVDVDATVDEVETTARPRQRPESDATTSPSPRAVSPRAVSPRVSGGALAVGSTGASSKIASPGDKVLGSPTSDAFASPSSVAGSPTSTTPRVVSPPAGAGTDSPSANVGVTSPAVGVGTDSPSAVVGTDEGVGGSPAATAPGLSGFEAGVPMAGPTPTGTRLAMADTRTPAQPGATSGREQQDRDVKPFFGGRREADFTDFRNPLEYEQIIETQPVSGETPGQAAAFDEPKFLGYLNTN